jgi:hypothetical protein
MKLALEELGYGKIYHFSTLFHEPTHVDLWASALKAKYQTGSKIPPSHWEAILSDYAVRPPSLQDKR